LEILQGHDRLHNRVWGLVRVKLGPAEDLRLDFPTLLSAVSSAPFARYGSRWCSGTSRGCAAASPELSAHEAHRMSYPYDCRHEGKPAASPQSVRQEQRRPAGSLQQGHRRPCRSRRGKSARCAATDASRERSASLAASDRAQPPEAQPPAVIFLL
jgi:hypothetical protein